MPESKESFCQGLRGDFEPTAFEVLSMKDRKRYLGGTDAAGVLGLSRWATPLSVWAAKTGQVEGEDISGRLAVKLGHKLEHTVAELFMEATGKKVQRVNDSIFHQKHSFIAATQARHSVPTGVAKSTPL